MCIQVIIEMNNPKSEPTICIAEVRNDFKRLAFQLQSQALKTLEMAELRLPWQA